MPTSALLSAIALLCSVALARPTPASPQMARDPGPTVGTLIVAHGGGPAWDARVEKIAAEVRLAGPVGVSFLMGPGAKTHRFQDAVADLARRGAREIVVVPMLVSSHSGHYEQIRYLVGERDDLDTTMIHHLRMSGIGRAASGVPLRLTKAVDDAPEIADVLAERAKGLAKDPSKQALFLVGHGPNSAEDYAEWMANLRRVADTVRARTGFRSVLLDLVRDDAPPRVRAEAVARVRELIQLQHQLTGRDVVVVPVLISSGRVSTEKLPKDLEGLPISYTDEGLLPHSGMARWVESRVRGAVGDMSSSRRGAELLLDRPRLPQMVFDERTGVFDQRLELRVAGRLLSLVREVEHGLVRRDLMPDVGPVEVESLRSRLEGIHPLEGQRRDRVVGRRLGSDAQLPGEIRTLLPQPMVVGHHHPGESLDPRVRRLYRGERTRRAVGIIGVIEQGDDVGVAEVRRCRGAGSSVGRYGDGLPLGRRPGSAAGLVPTRVILAGGEHSGQQEICGEAERDPGTAVHG
jgi:sirohydrochlorin cobaltochelatase